METQFPVHELGEAEGDIVNCESVPGKTGSLSGSSYSSHSMMAIHYVPLSPRRRRLARFIFATLLIVGSLGSCAANATSIEGADPTTAKEPAAESVLVGLHVERISEVNDTARTFTAEFELGLRYRGAFDPKDLLLLDTLKPLVLDQPEESTDRDGEHFRLFHLNATFRFKSESKDITRNVHKLAIQLCRRNPPAGGFQLIPDMGGMGLDKAGASWGDALRDDDVLSGVAGWEMQSGEVKGGPLNVTQRFGRGPESWLVATMTIRRVVVSPKAIVAALIPPKVERGLALGALAVLAILLAGTWCRPARRISRHHVLLIRLLLGTLGFFLFESWTMTTAGPFDDRRVPKALDLVRRPVVVHSGGLDQRRFAFLCLGADQPSHRASRAVDQPDACEPGRLLFRVSDGPALRLRRAVGKPLGGIGRDGNRPGARAPEPDPRPLRRDDAQRRKAIQDPPVGQA